jgi:DNA-binding GntR family transcriptional regulator
VPPQIGQSAEAWLRAVCGTRSLGLTWPRASGWSRASSRPCSAEAVANGELLRYSALIAELHGLLRESAGQAIAGGLVERLRAQIVRHQFRLSLCPGRPARSLLELEQLIKAVVDRDPDRAKVAARSHLQSVIAALRAAEY